MLDKTTLRTEELRREIAEIRNANRIYQMHATHNGPENRLHEARRQRLREIVIELCPASFSVILAKSATPSAENHGTLTRYGTG